ncbi:MAG: ABC transporter permease subunit [Clostridiaceae bacterium]|nr:ABC transporter permease subunit [Clostridiaceae bacterium]
MSIFLLEFRNIRKSVLTWTLSVGSIIFLMLAFFPSMKTEAMQAIANAKLDSIDPAILAAMGIKEIPDFTIITNFFGYILQFITLALMVFATHQAVSMLIKEESDGTIEYLYSKPVSRDNILTQKIAAHVVSFCLMLLVFIVITISGYLAFSDYSFTKSLKESLIIYGGILFVGLIFSSVGFLASSLIRSSRSSAAITIAIVFGTFVLGATSAVVKELDFLVYFSPMDWIKAQKLLSDGLKPAEWVIGVGLILICTLCAWARYRRKDLLV